MGIIRFIDDITSFLVSDIKKQTGKGFFQTFFNSGNYGEFLSYKYLFFTPGKRDFLHNCYIPIENGFTEIDLIMLHETGIYVIESKNYSGWIFGDEKQKEWTQVIAGGRTKNHFYNPVWQNKGHIKALKTFLCDFPDLPYYSLIVFSERCELKNAACSTENAFVIKRNQLKSVFKKQIKDKRVYPMEKRIEIYNQLLPLCKTDKQEKQMHVDRINRMKKAMEVPESVSESESQFINHEQASPEQPGICPRCGNPLVRRNGKQGPFIGCSGFPKCRYTVKSL
jgi:hypothetical protein